MSQTSQLAYSVINSFYPVSPASVYTTISGLGVTMWWYAMLVLLIYHCILVLSSLEISTFLSKLLQ